jgi:ornithine carbamoyltransferase
MNPSKNLLKINDLTVQDLSTIFKSAADFKKNRLNPSRFPLKGQSWGLIFSKSSTRTRVSFEVAVRELGGSPMFLSAQDIQLGRGEPIKDTARVLGRMIHGAIIRTYAQSDVDDFAAFSHLPTVNALTDEEHPCQILTDIFTFEEKRGSIAGKTVAFIGDAACNVPRSWVYAAELLGFKLHLAAPEGYQSPLTNSHTKLFSSPSEAARGADLLYTDVWVSMGMEAEAAVRQKAFQGYQLNHELMKIAAPNALVMHCLPAYRGKEITEELMEERAQDIFDQAENRLHVQKGILDWIVTP